MNLEVASFLSDIYLLVKVCSVPPEGGMRKEKQQLGKTATGIQGGSSQYLQNLFSLRSSHQEKLLQWIGKQNISF